MSLEWIEGVPADWHISKAQFVLDYQKRDVQEDDEIVTAFRDGQVTLRGNRRTDGFTMAEKEIGYQHICEGDLVVHSMDGGFGAIGVSDSCGKASPVVHAYTSSLCDLRFVAYQLRAAVKAGWIAALAKGIRVRSTQFDRPALASLNIAYPTVGTQQRIADYLDRETAEIDAAVADLDKYVELLELRARTLIKQQLSGDHPQVKMGLLADAIIGITYSPNDVVEEGGTKVYRSGNVQDSRINRQNMLAVNVEIPPHLRFQEDDILMCSRNGSANLVGKNAIVGPEDLGHTWGAFMTVIRSDLNRYLFWFFRSPQFDAHRGLFSTSTINQLTTGILNRIPVPLPPKGRRDEIVKALDLEMHEIDSLIAESTKLRDLLLKRRSVLITEVVTGRKQV